MVAIGPRVGGAHVSVSLRYNASSAKVVRQQIQRQLASIADRNRAVYQSLGRETVTIWRAALGAIVTGAPLAGSALSGVAGAATMLAGSLYSTVQSAYALAPVLSSVGIAAGTARIGMQGFTDAVKAANPEELTKALKNLSPSARESALAVRSLRDEARQLRLVVQERMFKGLSDDIRLLATTLFPVMEQGLEKMAGALNRVGKSLLDYVNSRAGLEQIELLLSNSADIFDRLGKAAVPILDGILRLLNALAPAGQRMADRIADVGRSFQSWTQAEGFGNRIDSMMRRAEKTAGLLWKTLRDLGAGIINIFNAANPATNTFLEMLGGVTERFKEWTSSVEGQNSIAKWASESVEVMRQFGRTISSVFEVLNQLSDSRVIISFLATVEDAFDNLSKLPLAEIVGKFADLAEALQPISGPLLAIVISLVSFNVIVGSVMGQIAGAVTMFGSFGSAISGLFKPFSLAGKHAKDLTGLAAAFARLGNLLKVGLRFAGIAGIAIWIASIIAKSEELRAKVGEVVSVIGGVFGQLMSTFKQLYDAIKPVLDVVEPLIAFLIKVSLNSIIAQFKVLGVAIKVAGNIIAGVLTFVVSIITKVIAVGKTIWKILSPVFSALASGIQAVVKVVVAAFNRWLSIVSSVMRAILGVMSSVLHAILRVVTPVFNAIWSVVSTVFNAIWTVVSTVWNGILSVIKFVVNAIWTTVQVYFGLIVAVATTIWSSVLGTVTSVVTAIWSAVEFYFNLVLGIITAVWNTVSSVIKSVLDVIWGNIKRVFDSIKNTVSTVWNTIKSIITTTWDGIKSTVSSSVENVKSTLTGLWNRAKQVVDDIKGLGGGMWDWLKSGLRSVVNSIVDMLNVVVRGTNKLIDGVNKVNPLKDIPKIPTISKFARGTSFAPGGLALVGEEGPELVTLPRGSRVNTAAETRNILGQGTGGNTNYVINVSVDMSDLEQLHTLDQFLEMLDRSRVVHRQTSRSGTVTA